MTESELAELGAVLAQMPVADLVRIKKLVRTELDRRATGTTTKRIVHPYAAWHHLLKRGPNSG